MYKTTKSNEDSDDISIGFHRGIQTREQKLTDIERIKGIYQIKRSLKDVFGFREHQKNATYEMGYKLTLR